MSLRSTTSPTARTVLLGATVAAACAALSVFALPASAVTRTAAVAVGRVGLYGSQDPTYDGVYRQSLSLLALHAAGQSPATSAIEWLLAQQCPDGGFESFRADVTSACTAPDSAGFAGQDSNSTGMAVQALVALGKGPQVASAVAWLGAHQSSDGGWAYYPDGVAGNDSDANSTSLGLSAYSAAGLAAPVKNGATPRDRLTGLQVGCTGVVDERGAFTFFGSANDYATVQATLALSGGFLPVAAAAGADDAPTTTCPPGITPNGATLAGYAAGYLVRRLAANADVVPDPFNVGATDFGSTANAVIALAATKHGTSQVTATMTKLAGQVQAYVRASGADVPGALATLALAAQAAGIDPATLGGTNLVSRLVATLTLAAPTPTASPSPSTSQSAPLVDPDPSVRPALAATGATNATDVSGMVAGLLLATGVCLVLVARRRGATARPGHGS